MQKSWGTQPQSQGQQVKPQTKTLWFLFGAYGHQITPQVPAVPYKLGR